MSVPNQDVQRSRGASSSSSTSSSSVPIAGPSGSPSRPSGLDSFSTNLCKFTRYNSIRPLATLSYTADMFNNASIVSSIEFDKDNDFFAIAGIDEKQIAKEESRIKLRELYPVLLFILKA